MYIHRYLDEQVHAALRDGFVTILYGARQVGKTTLANKILSQYTNGLYLNCDDSSVLLRLEDHSLARLRSLIGNAKIVVIDEAQRVRNIGLVAKLIHDAMPTVKVLLTGSSSLDLANKIKEPLTGRSKEFILYPLGIKEIANNLIEADGYLKRLLVYGGYPGLWFLSDIQASERARDIANRYLYRDAFALGTVYDQTIIDNLLRLLALQIGSEVSYSELAGRLEISKETVMRYIDLLEKAFIVFRVSQFRKNQRVQIGRLRKLYFYDLGMRNALVDDFRPIELRGDVGALWENLIQVERLKKHQNNQVYVRSYYWRSRDRQELDIIEESSNLIEGYECKWNKEARVPAGFVKAYPNIAVQTITNKNYWDFV